MNHIAIRVENLSKLYKIGARQESNKTLRESIMGTLTAPFRRLDQKANKAPNDAPQAPSLFDSRTNTTLSAPCSMPSSCDDYIWALKDVSFEIKRGEVVGIIGRNGAGKTTLLKILSRITEPSEGRAEICGRVGSLLEVGTGFHPELTGRENIYLNGAILGMRKAEIERKFDEIVSFAEIEKFMDTPVKRYSSGMYVRLAFSVAAHLEPDVLLVDEVLAVGDMAFQNKCLAKMGYFTESGKTVIFVSHNMAAIENLCHRVCVIEHGCLVFDGDVTAGLEAYFDIMREVTLTPLSQRKDRQGSGLMRIESFEILDSTGNPVECLVTGRDYIFRFGYECVTEKVYDIDFTFTVRDSRNQVLFRNRTAESGILIPDVLSRRGYLDCRIPRFPLTEGKYAFGFRLLLNGTESDYITGAYAAYFDVISGDYFGTGNITKFAPVVVDHEWQIVPDITK